MTIDIAEAHRRRDARSSTSPPLRSAHTLAPLLQAVATLHELASSAVVVVVELDTLARAIRRAGRRLEDALDGERALPLTSVVARTVEPDIVPLADAVAALASIANQPGADAAFADIAEALAVVVETELGPALTSTCKLPGFELPRPWRTTFQPQRHQLLERSEGPRDVVIAVERCGRLGPGGRLLDPALVIVGAGST